MRVLAFPSACCLPLTRMGPAVCWVAAMWRGGNSPAGHAPACKEPCLQEVLPAELPGAGGVLAGKGFIPREVGSSLRACIPTWRSAVVCRAVSFPLCSG